MKKIIVKLVAKFKTPGNFENQKLYILNKRILKL